MKLDEGRLMEIAGLGKTLSTAKPEHMAIDEAATNVIDVDTKVHDYSMTIDAMQVLADMLKGTVVTRLVNGKAQIRRLPKIVSIDAIRHIRGRAALSITCDDGSHWLVSLFREAEVDFQKSGNQYVLNVDAGGLRVEPYA